MGSPADSACISDYSHFPIITRAFCCSQLALELAGYSSSKLHVKYYHIYYLYIGPFVWSYAAKLSSCNLHIDIIDMYIHLNMTIG
jgi:hypothetical protein